MKWISVDERMPSTCIDVLVYRSGGITLGGYDSYEGFWYDQGLRCGKVTHWMPLPDKPKKEEINEG